jgi:predicted  nucleic acid-binding Zn-ribbon protein
MGSEKPKGVNTGRIISAVLIAGLAALTIVFYIRGNNYKSDLEARDTEVGQMTAEIENLERDLDDYKVDLENKDLALEEKERLLAEKEQQLIDKQKKIDQLLKQGKISTKEAESLRAKVESLEFYIKKYQDEIDDLKRQIAEKDTMIADLGGKIDTISGKLRTTQGQLDETQFKLETAKILSARPFHFYRTKVSGKEIEETSFRKGQLDGMKICFDINQNLAADRGSKTAYVQVKAPDGKVIRDEAKAGFFQANGEDLPFSSSTNFNYDREAMKVCVNFDKPADFDYDKGDYTVVVYCEGYDIGKAKFSVK